MNVNERQLRELIRQGEGLTTEFKSCRDQLSRDVYATVCAFLNRHGGSILLGVEDSGTIVTDNPSRPHGFGLLNPDTVVPYQKNPILSAFFREIDRADELGSGMRKMMLYGKRYGGADPQLIEGDNFRMIISVPEFGENPAVTPVIKPHKQVTPHVTPQVGEQLESQLESRLKSQPESLADRILRALTTDALGKGALAIGLGQKQPSGQLHVAVRSLLGEGLIEMTVPEKPNSRLQKYRLTDKGRALLKELKS